MAAHDQKKRTKAEGTCGAKFRRWQDFPCQQSSREVLALKACVLSSVPKLLQQNNVLVNLLLQDDHRAISRDQKKVVLLIALDLGLLLPIRALLVECIVRWQSLEPHSKQTIFSFSCSLLSILLFGALTFWHSLPIFGALDGFFLTFFGWGAYLLILGLIAFAIAHLIEGTRKTRFIRWSLV